jgi:uncharacterized protein GlcG (DUF336 family)
MAMTERHDESASSRRRMSTGEFRAAPDISASTAQFRAFAEDGTESPMGLAAPDRSRTRIAILIGGVIVVLAIIAILGATLG